ncbi:hypothetical protein BGP78_10955 [Pseudoalteromonas sp. MSK9-3]|nr:hypothetical protein BGP78_10955 [Pseudoalteromonas sp. MSK9-3]
MSNVNESSYLNTSNTPSSAEVLPDSGPLSPTIKAELQRVKGFETKGDTSVQEQNLALKFSSKELLKVTVNALHVNDYLHYVFGDLLGVSYVLGDELAVAEDTITLSLQELISKRRLFTLSESVLESKGIKIRYNNDVYYIYSDKSGSQGNIAYGFGSRIEDVPDTTADIMQMVPFKFGMQSQISMVLQSVAQIQVIPMIQQNAFLLRGKRNEIIKALQFVKLVDRPSLSSRTIGIYKAVFVSVDEVTDKLPKILEQEGITVANGNAKDKAVSLISLNRTGSVVIFAPNEVILERIMLWVKTIDQPVSGDEKQYYVYQPEFSRATDLGHSLSSLIGSSSGLSNTSSARTEEVNSSSDGSRSSQGVSASNKELKMVVDERANSIIFHSTGQAYKKLLPLIKRLDVSPKQVVLEVLIAEVTLTDEFKQGVEFALSNKDSATSTGFYNLAFKNGLTYTLSGLDGKYAVSLLETNKKSNIVSRPTLAVRDGVTAKINIGDSIPIVGEIVTDPVNGSRTSTEYRRTGLDLEVTPTVNAQGVIIMNIVQKFSNQIPGDSTTAGNPTILERNIATEVIAGNGQTILLGGMISENNTDNDNNVPFFSSIPILGNLFKGVDDSTSKTELVVLVTPRIIESTVEWQPLYQGFKSRLTELNLGN